MDKTIWQTALTDTPTSDKFLDAGRLRAVGPNVYRFVLNGTGAAVALGDVLYFGTSDLTKGTVYQLGQAAKGTTVNSMAGVAMAACASGSYLWIQVLGYNASINTLGVAAANEVQTIAVDTIMSGGSIQLDAQKSDGSWIGVKVTYNTTWTQTVADIQTALIAQLGAAAVACAVTNTHDMTVTFSGAGYASLPQSSIRANISAATGPTKVQVSRTTQGVAGTAVGDVLGGVSGQNYCTKLSSAGTTGGISNHVQADIAYATAVAALKAGTIRCLQ